MARKRKRRRGRQGPLGPNARGSFRAAPPTWPFEPDAKRIARDIEFSMHSKQHFRPHFGGGLRELEPMVLHDGGVLPRRGTTGRDERWGFDFRSGGDWREPPTETRVQRPRTSQEKFEASPKRAQRSGYDRPTETLQSERTQGRFGRHTGVASRQPQGPPARRKGGSTPTAWVRPFRGGGPSPPLRGGMRPPLTRRGWRGAGLPVPGRSVEEPHARGKGPNATGCPGGIRGSRSGASQWQRPDHERELREWWQRWQRRHQAPGPGGIQMQRPLRARAPREPGEGDFQLKFYKMSPLGVVKKMHHGEVGRGADKKGLWSTWHKIIAVKCGVVTANMWGVLDAELPYGDGTRVEEGGQYELFWDRIEKAGGAAGADVDVREAELHTNLEAAGLPKGAIPVKVTKMRGAEGQWCFVSTGGGRPICMSTSWDWSKEEGPRPESQEEEMQEERGWPPSP